VASTLFERRGKKKEITHRLPVETNLEFKVDYVPLLYGVLRRLEHGGLGQVGGEAREQRTCDDNNNNREIEKQN